MRIVPLLSASFSLVLMVLPASARAEGSSPEPLSPDNRPIPHVSLELNPLAPLAGRFGGQAGVGIYGPLVLSLGVSRVSLADSQHYSAYDETTWGNPAVHGWSFEVGPRVYIPLSGGKNKTRVDAFVALSYLRESLHEDGAQTCTKGGTCEAGEGQDVSRDGLASDLGFQVTTPPGFYFVAGVGHEWITSDGARLSRQIGSSAPIPDLSPMIVQRGDKWPRLLLSVGWAL